MLLLSFAPLTGWIIFWLDTIIDAVEANEEGKKTNCQAQHLWMFRDASLRNFCHDSLYGPVLYIYYIYVQHTHTHPPTHIHTYTHTYIYIYIYMYIW